MKKINEYLELEKDNTAEQIVKSAMNAAHNIEKLVDDVEHVKLILETVLSFSIFMDEHVGPNEQHFYNEFVVKYGIHKHSLAELRHLCSNATTSDKFEKMTALIEKYRSISEEIAENINHLIATTRLFGGTVDQEAQEIIDKLDSNL